MTPPRWTLVAAHLVPLTTLPAALWRLPVAFGASMGTLDHGVATHVHGWTSVYVIALSVVTEALAALTLGLVRPWGERVPAWIPRIGGRRIPPLAVVIPAATGAALLTAIWTFAVAGFPGEMEFSAPGWRALIVVCYAPLLLWGPLLAALTWAYHRRRRGAGRGWSPAAGAAASR